SILLQAGAGVGDVQVAHGQLTDTVVWTKGCVGNAFHGQFFWGVRQVVTGGIQDGVVVTAAQAEGDFTGDGGANPALNGFTDHQRLWIKPAAFVHQATQSVAVDVVVLDGVFVMDRIEQALVGDVQQGHSRCFVDAADLASIMRFSIWSETPRPWRPPMVLASRTSATGSVYSMPLMATGRPSWKRTETSSVWTSTSSRQAATPIMGSTKSRPTLRYSRDLASWVAPQILASVEYAFSVESRYG